MPIGIKRSNYYSKVLSTIKFKLIKKHFLSSNHMSKELPYSFDIGRGWQLDNEFNFCFINFNSLLRDDMPENNPLLYHEMALLPVKHQVFFNAPV